MGYTGCRGQMKKLSEFILSMWVVSHLKDFTNIVGLILACFTEWGSGEGRVMMIVTPIYTWGKPGTERKHFIQDLTGNWE